MITEKEVLAMLRTILAPILACYLDCGCLGVFVPRVGNVVLIEPLKYFITTFHSTKVVKLWQYLLQTRNKIYNFVKIMCKCKN